MFDTCAFNHVLDQNLDLEKVKSKGQLFVTHIQRDELNNCKNEERRNLLLQIFIELQDEDAPTESCVLDVSRLDQAKLSGGPVPTSSAVWDVSRWDEAMWTDPANSLYETIKNELDRIKKKPNNIQDALIGETALKNKYTFVTDDNDLYNVMKKYACQVMTLSEFLKF